MNTASKIIDECKARVSRTDPPQDCDWPYCDCDPAANWLNPKEAASLRARVAECEAEHPPEQAYLDWCSQGRPDVASLRAELEGLREAFRRYRDGSATVRMSDAVVEARSLRQQLAEAQARPIVRTLPYDETAEMERQARLGVERSLESLKERVRRVYEAVERRHKQKKRRQSLGTGELALLRDFELTFPDILATQPETKEEPRG